MFKTTKDRREETGRKISRHADKHTCRQADKHTSRQAGKQRGRQTDRKERRDLEKQGTIQESVSKREKKL